MDSLIISVGEDDATDEFSESECDVPYETGEESDLALALPEDN